MKVRAFFSWVSLLCFLLGCGNAYASDSELDRDTLKGIKGVFVLVEIDEEIVKNHLTEGMIMTDVELKLRLAGIAIPSKEEWLKESGSPYLYVGLNAAKIGQLGYSYKVHVGLRQQVFLRRAVILIFDSPFAETWSVGALGFAKEMQGIRDGTKNMVDMFINAYLSVNPKR